MITLDWSKGAPTTPGIYFVAIELGAQWGEYDFAKWSNAAWEHAAPDSILAWLPIELMVSALPADLPLPWRSANPLAPDWGFVRTETGILFADWDGTRWHPAPQSTVLGSVPLGTLLTKCRFNWPGTLAPLPETSAAGEANLAAWEEVPE
jgi:hypothetical protein